MQEIITGKWVLLNGRVVADKSCQVIDNKINNELIKISSLDSGWRILYKSRLDDSYWELTFPQSELEGGGPPQLRKLDLRCVNETWQISDKTE